MPECVSVCVSVRVRVYVPESTLNLNCQHNIFKNVESFIWHMAGIAKKRQQLTENNSVTGYESKHDWLTSSFLLVSPPVFLLVSPSSYLLISAINCAERNVTHAKSSKSKSKIKFESQSQRQRLKQNVF